MGVWACGRMFARFTPSMVTDTTAAVHCEGGGGAEEDDIHLVYCTSVHVQSGASGTSECAPPNKPAFVPMLTLRRCCLLRGDGRSEEANTLQMVAMATDPSSTQLAAASVIILHECFVRVRFGPVLQLPNMTQAEQFGCARHASLHSMVVSTQPGELLGLWEGELL